MQREEQILHCNVPDNEDGVADENQDEEPVAMIEESPLDVRLNLNCDGTFVISYVLLNIFRSDSESAVLFFILLIYICQPFCNLLVTAWLHFVVSCIHCTL